MTKRNTPDPNAEDDRAELERGGDDFLRCHGEPGSGIDPGFTASLGDHRDSLKAFMGGANG